METTNRLSAPPEAIGALYFLPGQYLFKRLEDGKESAKALSSQQVARAFREFCTDTGWINRRLLRYREEPAGNYLLACESAGIKQILVETGNGEVRKIKIPLPNLLLFGHLQQYYLWATKEKNVTPDTRICLAPLPNIGGNWNGKVCFGGNKVPLASLETLDEVWELIFRTPFNRDQSNQKCKSFQNDVRELLFNLEKEATQKFPLSELIVSNTTIGELWRHALDR